MIRSLKALVKATAKPLLRAVNRPGRITPPFSILKSSFSTLKPVFTNSSSAHRSYSHLPNDFFTATQGATQKMLSIDYDICDQAIAIFRENLFPAAKRPRIPQLIEIMIQENKHRLKGEQDVNAIARMTFSSLKTIMDFLDRGDKGLLSGDLSLPLITQLGKILDSEVSKLTEHGILPSKRDYIIEGIYGEVCKVAFTAGLFRLPLHGIAQSIHENPRNLFERQIALEEESNEIAVDRFMNIYEELEKLDLAFNLKFARSKIVEWFPSLCKAIKEEQEQCLLGDLKTDRKVYAPFIIKVTPEKLALISLTELMRAMLRFVAKRQEEGEQGYQHYSIISRALFETIGKAVNSQILFEFEEEMNKIFEEKENQQRLSLAQTENELNSLSQPEGNPQQKKVTQVAQKMLRKKTDSSIFDDVGLSKTVQLKIGSLMTYLMKETIKIKNQEGFWENLLSTTYTKTKNGKKIVGTLHVNEEFLLTLVNHIEQTDSLFIQMDRCMPMVFKPAPWQDHEIGGYYQKPTNFMRIHESILQERSIKYSNLKSMFDVLDILGETPWRINKKVLNVVETLWEQGGDIGEIPPRFYDYSNYIYTYQLKECRNIRERMKLTRKIQNQRDIHSLRCDFTLKLNVARAFQDVDRIYYPHNVDFRGRVYPIPPHLNHMGADISRGLLEFAEGKPIGPNGIRWLKIHLANKMGQDKLSMEDRIMYVESMMSLIENCAKDPITHKEWASFEDAWQTLAAMFELVSAMQCENPEEFISHIHVHQDGSCNGLQHYAALGRDYAGAVQVNLSKTEKPGDIYTHVANMVQRRVNEDSENPESKYHNIAKKLVGNVRRKIVKQTVMTTVYGVTFIGARKQIFKQLKDKEFMEDDDRSAYEASYYLALLTLDAVKHLFAGAHEIKAWLIQCAGLIAATSYPVSWITPLGLPVIQPYRSKGQIDVISTILQKVTLSTISDNLPLNKTKQKSAFPPNYIHSLDSTHLMYTAIECKKENITFAAVHDSYWTHIASIDRMNEILRDQFVRLHSQPLLETLKESFERRYPQLDFPPIPKRGDFNLEEVKTSQYFFA